MRGRSNPYRPLTRPDVSPSIENSLLRNDTNSQSDNSKYERMPWTMTERVPICTIFYKPILLWDAMFILARYSVPACFIDLPRAIFQISLFFAVGGLDTRSIAALEFALEALECVPILFTSAIGSFLNTHLPQIYGANNADPNYVVVFLRGLATLFPLLLCSAILFFFFESLLVLYGIERERAKLTGMVLRCMGPGVIALAPIRGLPRLFLNRGMLAASTIPILVPQLISTVAVLLFSHYYQTHITLFRVASFWSITMLFTATLQCASLLFYRDELRKISPWKYPDAREDAIVEPFFKLSSFVSLFWLTLSGTVLGAIIAQIDLALLFTIYVPEKEAAAAGIAVQLYNYLYYALAGTLAATSFFVAREVGSHHPCSAKRAAICCMIFALVATIFLAIPCLIFSKQIAQLLDKNAEVTTSINYAIIAAVLRFILAIPLLIFTRIFTAIGRQFDLASLCFPTIFLFGIPLDVFLATRLGGYGFFTGAPCIGLAVTLPLCYYWLAYRIDWVSEADKKE